MTSSLSAANTMLLSLLCERHCGAKCELCRLAVEIWAIQHHIIEKGSRGTTRSHNFLLIQPGRKVLNGYVPRETVCKKVEGKYTTQLVPSVRHSPSCQTAGRQVYVGGTPIPFHMQAARCIGLHNSIVNILLDCDE